MPSSSDAIGLMIASGALPGEEIADYVVFGELGLDASIATVAGCLPAAIGANALCKGLICPFACGAEAAFGPPQQVCPQHEKQLPCGGSGGRLCTCGGALGLYQSKDNS